MREFDRRILLRYSGMAAAGLMLRGERFAFGQEAPVATTTAGRISGRVENGINVFRGIPYGEDTKKTRFKAPMPVAPVGFSRRKRMALRAPKTGMRFRTTAAHPASTRVITEL